MTPTTRVSLALLWQRWQEIEELPEHDKTVLAELNVLEARIIDQPAKNARDLVAKLKFLAHQARDHEWDDSLEKLHASILSAQEDFLHPEEGPLDRLSQAIRHFKGIGECLESVAPDAPDPVKVCEYLGRELGKHAAMADAAVDDIGTEHYTKRIFLKEAVHFMMEARPAPFAAKADGGAA